MDQYPKDNRDDRLDAAARAAAGAVAGFANQAAGLPPGLLETVTAVGLSFLIAPIAARRDSWMTRLSEIVRELQERVGKIEDQTQIDRIVDAVLAATPAALRTTSKAKHEALHNAIIRSGLPGGPSDATARAFVRMVDDLDELHISMLRFLADPIAYLAEIGRPVSPSGHLGMGARPLYCSLGDAIDRAFGSYGSDLIAMVADDVERRRLASVNGSAMCNPGHGSLTSFGKEFVQFIGDPWK